MVVPVRGCGGASQDGDPRPGRHKVTVGAPNGRSSNFIAPSTANGCAMACAYCYVPCRKGYAKPITVFTDIDKTSAMCGATWALDGDVDLLS